MTQPKTQLEAKILHPSRWGRIPTEREVHLVQMLGTVTQQKMLDNPELLATYRQLCESKGATN